LIEIVGFTPSAYAGIQIKVTVLPEKLDIIPVRDQIILMDPEEALINVVSEYT